MCPSKKVVDFGCAECKLVRRLKDLPHVREILGVDLDGALLEDAARWTSPLAWEYLHPRYFFAFVASCRMGNV